MAHIYPKMERFVPRYGIYKLVMRHCENARNELYRNE